MTFSQLRLIEPLLQAVQEEGYTHPTEIQQQAIAPALAGRDLLGCAQTGTGKTAAFALPILQRLAQQAPRPQDSPVMAQEAPQGDQAAQPAQRRRGRRSRSRRGEDLPVASGQAPAVRALVLTPTRELAQQVADSFETYGKHLPLKTLTVYGGTKLGPQIKTLRGGVDILVATPGRLMDLAGRGHANISQVECFVLDEADRMLDMGFIDDIRKIIAQLPSSRQTMLFSATIPHTIQSLADSILDDPIRLRVTPDAPTADNIDQKVYYVDGIKKQALLQHLLEKEEVTRVLVFTRTKVNADRVGESLQTASNGAEVIHSDRFQKARQRALDRFREGKARVLVATDIAARGIDVDDITHVINYDLPEEPETYVHRIGRTGRAGASGQALSFCDLAERLLLSDIRKLVQTDIEEISDHPYKSSVPVVMAEKEKPALRGRRTRLKRRLL